VGSAAQCAGVDSAGRLAAILVRRDPETYGPECVMPS